LGLFGIFKGRSVIALDLRGYSEPDPVCGFLSGTVVYRVEAVYAPPHGGVFIVMK
jgi:hypothetical protein